MIKTILLTGATGFLGSHLLEALIKEDYETVILKRSFSNTGRIDKFLDKVKSYDIDIVPIEKAFKEQKIDVVIHTATNYGRKNEKVSEIVDVNLIFSLKLLEIATDFNINTFFNTDTLQYKHISNYTRSKKQFAEWLKVFGEAKKTKVVNLSLEHMYGPGDDANKFVVWLMEQMLSNVDEINLTTGKQKRDFIYIDDIVNAYMLLLRQSKNLPQVSEFDVCTGKQVSVREFVLKLKDTIESINNKPISTKLNFGAIPYRKGEMMEVVENVTPLLDIGWKPNFILADGLKLVVSEYIERGKNI
ncbi:NAD-dependent epimerase/dehydratase [Methanosarcina sp.]|uniref:NAD-dependent epimerase/dehydratase family protein n=1 Tax=Methanosarcina sp. TaxID=2213 RepID=UPI0029896851|nr:NAD-dependent epimerase/dehydratase [Methanosarcina sp.]MDW5549193.1 NAD-dependent epimerase/dehydratase [Methanosarcina sp.]MDW5553101.1 NAD-dependent epimerase/dehydratase [Methanosarcina sp.]MDW5559373.1 NAD-dependent epimerase/dehydratase [Methanosarcina sp.]